MAKSRRCPLSSSVLACAFLLLCLTSALAQEGAPPSSLSAGPPQAGTQATKRPAEETGPRDEAATFKVKVNLVLVRVVVRDAKGNIVGHLKKEDFQLFDRGKPQEIEAFTEEEAAGAKTTTEAPRLAGSAENSGTPPLALPPDRYVAYLFDDVHMAFADLARVRDAAIRHLATLSPRDRAALFTTSGRGDADFTDDRARLENALRQLQPRPITGGQVSDCPVISPYQAGLMRSSAECSGMSHQEPKSTRQGQGPQVPQDPAVRVATLEVANCRQVDLEQARREACRAANAVLDAGQHEGEVSLFVLKEVIRRMAALSGQRSILLLSPGFYAEPMRYRYEELVDQALRAQVTISALNGRGLYTVDTLGDVSVVGTQTPLTINDKATLIQAAAAADEGVLGLLAYGTGGSYYHNSNDFDQGFREIAAPPEYVYLLGFSPRNLKLDGKFHELKVTVRDSSKLTIQARKGYYATRLATEGPEPAKTQIQEAKAPTLAPDVVLRHGGTPEAPGEAQTQPGKPRGEKAQFDVIALSVPQPQFVLCEDGSGRFETSFAGVTVAVGATKRDGFAQHSCAASLAWEGHELPVAKEAAQVDIDVLGADLGLDTPVVAFQVKKSAADWEMTYAIYSLSKSPQLLRTITGGDFYRAADADLSGRIAIWTGDVAALRGFEGFSPGDFDFAPTMVLRLEHNQLVDASSAFPSYFDGQIAAVRAGLSAQEVSDFRKSDGRLAEVPSSAIERAHGLRSTKIKVLEIVWSYLNSGRDQEAWGALDGMWPREDLGRIRAAILNAQAHGIRSQIDGVSTAAPQHPGERKPVRIYDALSESSREYQRTPGFYEGHSPFVNTKPQAIVLRRPSPPGGNEPLPESEQTIELVIDAAGKVWSAKLHASRPEAGLPGTPPGGSDQELIDAARGWKFIPAFEKGRAVACRFLLEVLPDR
jgi:VWFA-related protein